ncbi:PucR family transcriptional regulator [Amycolatopsis sp. cg5]|uniref:PucR family transcriptional regulator n=1 Tax=Amycolatopsis sp. cg5 TaxID=3238802 RepID=UPI00352659DB
MALSLRELAGSLGLVVRAGEGALDRAIGWVHPTELTDPNAFLEGGELLLTTGLALDEHTSGAYVRRLVEARVAGLGFGIGLSHLSIPAALVATAAEVGLPVLEVPRRTPFIAITRAVSRAVAADEYASVVRTGRGQQELTRAAVGRGGPGAVVRRLARLVDGWALLLDAGGAVIEAAPASARGFGPGLAGELRRLKAGARVARIGEHEVVVQTLDTRARGYLAVGKDALDAADRYIVNTAVSLLSLALEQDRAQEGAVRRLRSVLLDLLADKPESAVRSMRTLWGGAPAPPWSVLAVSGTPAARRVLFDALEAEFEDLPERPFFAESGPFVVILCSAEAESWVLEKATGLHAGASMPVSLEDFSAGLRQAEQASRAAQAKRVPVVRFADHAAHGLVELVDPEVAQAFAGTLLAPLRQHDATGRGDLVTSLRCWLEHHGHWDLAANQLDVHRHTLRNRMRKVEELTGRSLDSPGFRAELWLALQV